MSDPLSNRNEAARYSYVAAAHKAIVKHWPKWCVDRLSPQAFPDVRVVDLSAMIDG
jgi:hypothetical protein